jgi:hypothetical protein
MPCSRFERLPVIVPAYTSAMEKSVFEVRLHLLLQGPDPDPKGILKVNECLNEIRGDGGWFMTPSDDSIPYPSLFRRMGEELEKMPDAIAIVVSQERRDALGNLWAAPDQMMISRVDGNQICWNRDWIKEERYEWEKWGIFCDGEFAVRLYAKAPQRFIFINELLVRHNSLEAEWGNL